MHLQPGCIREVEDEVAVLDGAVVAFANVAEAENPGRGIGSRRMRFVAAGRG